MKRIKAIAEDYSLLFGSNVFASARIFSSWETDEVFTFIVLKTLLFVFLKRVFFLRSLGYYGRAVPKFGNCVGLRFCYYIFTDRKFLCVYISPPLCRFDSGKNIFHRSICETIELDFCLFRFAWTELCISGVLRLILFLALTWYWLSGYVSIMLLTLPTHSWPKQAPEMSVLRKQSPQSVLPCFTEASVRFWPSSSLQILIRTSSQRSLK